MSENKTCKQESKRKDALRDAPLEKRYRHAILVLQAISQRDGCYKNGGCDEWSEAYAYQDCQKAAERAMEYLGEPTTMPNKAKNGSGAET